ncbi:MAG: type II secretion system F family protein [Acidimicrobiia bacterium]
MSVDPVVSMLALCVATFVALAVAMVVRPTRMIGWRVRPYAQLSRSRLGRGADASAVIALDGSLPDGVLARILGPIGASLARTLSGMIDAGDDDALRLRLRQAGFLDTSPEQYRMRQLAWTVGGLAGGVALGLVAASALVALVGGALGALMGAMVWRGRVKKAIRVRVEAMRIEIYTVAQLLAMLMRTGSGLTQAVQFVVRRGNGPVVGELGEALNWINGGMSTSDAYELLANTTPEPAAARLYRALAESGRSGGDLASSLLSISEDLRSERREQFERDATKRRGAMLIPVILVMAPVVLLFLLAPVPKMLFGN